MMTAWLHADSLILDVEESSHILQKLAFVLFRWSNISMQFLAYSQRILLRTNVVRSTGLVRLIKNDDNYMCLIVMNDVSNVYLHQCYAG